MKTILLMRHSHASSQNPAWSDHERPLTEDGRQLAIKTGKLLADYDISQIICSSATRTVETAKLIATICNATAGPESTDSLYLAGPDAYAIVASDLAKQDNDAVLMIGHNPGIASLIMSWAGQSFSMSPASVAVFDLNIDDWADVADREKYKPSLRSYLSDGVRKI